jgi:hypothetical protein
MNENYRPVMHEYKESQTHPAMKRLLRRLGWQGEIPRGAWHALMLFEAIRDGVINVYKS